MILGGGVAVCLLLSAHRAVIFTIIQLSCSGLNVRRESTLLSAADRWPTSSSLLTQQDSMSSDVVDAACVCGCQLQQPVGQIIIAANHSCFPTTTGHHPVTWHIIADPGRVVRLTFRLLTGNDHHGLDTDGLVTFISFF